MHQRLICIPLSLLVFSIFLTLPTIFSVVLNPMSASARLKLNLKPGVDLSLPQVTLQSVDVLVSQSFVFFPPNVQLLVGVECEDIVFSLQQIQVCLKFGLLCF